MVNILKSTFLKSGIVGATVVGAGKGTAGVTERFARGTSQLGASTQFGSIDSIVSTVGIIGVVNIVRIIVLLVLFVLFV